MTGEFDAAERKLLSRYFTNLDDSVFALINMPEVVKGALFARYSRSPKGLRRLFLDEFMGGENGDQLAGDEDAVLTGEVAAAERAEALYERVFTEYGDDSVAQLGGAHIACENVSNVVTKLIERGRLMAYLEQSTRYIRYDLQVDGRYRFHNPFSMQPALYQRFEEFGTRLFEAYTEMYSSVEQAVRERYPNDDEDTPSVYEAAVKAKVCDVLRGLLPAGTRSSLGIFGSGQAYEALVMRLLASPNEEARSYGEKILNELKKVIPSFLRRVEIPDRGGRWIEFLEEREREKHSEVANLARPVSAHPGDSFRGPSVSISSFDPDGEIRIAAAAIFSASRATDAQARTIAGTLSERDLDRLFDSLCANRANRRHKPGREFEATSYRFEIVSDYGAFRDLQRHRMLSIEWQPLGVGLGFATPGLIAECNLDEKWSCLMGEAAELYCDIPSELEWTKPYVVPMAYRIRYVMEMNAREAMHVIELRTSPQGHEEYRRVCSEMHRLIAEVAGHRRIAGSMAFVSESEESLERLAAERDAARRRKERSNEGSA